MKRNLTALGLLICLLLSFGGCQLAQPAATTDSGADRMVGAFITKEHLNLFDMESYINDHAQEAFSGKHLVAGPEDSDKYGLRVYGTMGHVEETDIYGNSYTAIVFDFGGLEGLSLMAPTITEDGDLYTAAIGSQGITSTNWGIHSYGLDSRNTALTLSGTIYVDPALMDNPAQSIGMFVNPVYQSPDGQVYLTEGQGISTGSTIEGDKDYLYGGNISQTLEQTWEVNLGNEVKTAHTSIQITLTTQPCSEQAHVYHMDDRHRIVKEESLTMTDDLYNVTMAPDAAYVIAEVVDRNGNMLRSLCNPDGNFELFVPMDDGLLSRHEITVERPGSPEPDNL